MLLYTFAISKTLHRHGSLFATIENHPALGEEVPELSILGVAWPKFNG